ncbi:MAG: hypothetical protein AAFX04_13235 [Pseudomonadota bacterium]
MAPGKAQEIRFVEDGLGAANRWVEDNPKDVAIIVRFGAKTAVDPKVIVYWLQKDFADNGCSATHFLFERGAGGSAVGFVTRNHAWGPFSLADSRKSVAETCKQHLFEVERGLN